MSPFRRPSSYEALERKKTCQYFQRFKKNGSTFIYLEAHLSFTVFVWMDKCATWLMLDRASPRNPYVLIVCRSSNVASLDVVNRSQTILRSSFRIPVPLSRIFKWREFRMKYTTDKGAFVEFSLVEIWVHHFLWKSVYLLTLHPNWKDEKTINNEDFLSICIWNI